MPNKTLADYKRDIKRIEYDSKVLGALTPDKLPKEERPESDGFRDKTPQEIAKESEDLATLVPDVEKDVRMAMINKRVRKGK